MNAKFATINQIAEMLQASADALSEDVGALILNLQKLQDSRSPKIEIIDCDNCRLSGPGGNGPADIDHPTCQNCMRCYSDMHERGVR